MSSGSLSLFVMVSFGSTLPFFSTSMSFVVGSYFSLSANFSTVIVISTSSVVLSAYVTTTVAFCSPGVLVSTAPFLKVYVASFGKSAVLAIPDLASTTAFCFTVRFFPCGSYFSLSANFSTVIVISTSSVVLSAYVTTTVAFCSPGVLVSTAPFLKVYVASFGKSAVLAIPDLASTTAFCFTVRFFPCGSYFSLSANFSMVIVISTSSVVLSAYVTTTVAFCSPGVLVSTGPFLKAYVASFGKSAVLAIPDLASTTAFCFTVRFWPCGVYSSLSGPST